ncbi:MAG: hypothetical protein WDW38_007270 [Sanguina aurantia]
MPYPLVHYSSSIVAEVEAETQGVVEGAVEMAATYFSFRYPPLVLTSVMGAPVEAPAPAAQEDLAVGGPVDSDDEDGGDDKDGGDDEATRAEADEEADTEGVASVEGGVLQDEDVGSARLSEGPGAAASPGPCKGTPSKQGTADLTLDQTSKGTAGQRSDPVSSSGKTNVDFADPHTGHHPHLPIPASPQQQQAPDISDLMHLRQGYPQPGQQANKLTQWKHQQPTDNVFRRLAIAQSSAARRKTPPQDQHQQHSDHAHPPGHQLHLPPYSTPGHFSTLNAGGMQQQNQQQNQQSNHAHPPGHQLHLPLYNAPGKFGTLNAGGMQQPRQHLAFDGLHTGQHQYPHEAPPPLHGQGQGQELYMFPSLPQQQQQGASALRGSLSGGDRKMKGTGLSLDYDAQLDGMGAQGGGTGTGDLPSPGWSGSLFFARDESDTGDMQCNELSYGSPRLDRSAAFSGRDLFDVARSDQCWQRSPSVSLGNLQADPLASQGGTSPGLGREYSPDWGFGADVDALVAVDHELHASWREEDAAARSLAMATRKPELGEDANCQGYKSPVVQDSPPCQDASTPLVEPTPVANPHTADNYATLLTQLGTLQIAERAKERSEKEIWKMAHDDRSAALEAEKQTLQVQVHNLQANNHALLGKVEQLETGQRKETKKTRAASPHRDNGPDNSGVAAPHLPHPSLNHSGVAAAPRPPKGGMDQNTDASAPPRLARGSHNGGGAATSLPAPWPVKRTLSAPSPWQPGDSSSASSPSAAARAPSVASGDAATAEALTPVIRGRRADDAASPTRASSISGAAVTALPVRGEKGGGREGNPGHGIKREGGENGDGGVDKKDGDGVQMDE